MPKVRKPRVRTKEEVRKHLARIEEMVQGMGRAGMGQYTSLHPMHAEIARGGKLKRKGPKFPRSG